MTSVGQSATEYELAGLLEEGRFARTPFPIGQALKPTFAWLEEDLGLVIACQLDRMGEFVPTVGALERFLAIRTPNDVLDFATKFGVVGFCEHDLPIGHNPRRAQAGSGFEQRPCVPRSMEVKADGTTGLVFFDPVTRYYDFIAHFKAILSVAAALRRNQKPADGDWALLGGRPYGPDWSVQRERFWLSVAIDDVLGWGDAMPGVVWRRSTDAPKMEIRSSIFGILALQLAAAVSGAHGIEQCDGCGTLYPRVGRRPQRGRRNFCTVCRDSKAPVWRENKRAERARRGEGTKHDTLARE